MALRFTDNSDSRPKPRPVLPIPEELRAAVKRLDAVKRGRPRIEDKAKTLTAKQPWKALGMSRRTWERRRKERGK